MRYIYYIITILIVLSAGIGYELIVKHVPVKEAALIINGRVISTDEFKRLYSSRPSHLKDKSDFINHLITKELLIQESQKEGIDKEESFRNSIQNFYEQSLIKLLMDRKCGSIRSTQCDDELNRYISFMNKRLHLTIFSFDTAEEARKGDFRDGESKILNSEDLSKDIRDNVISLREGQMTEPFKIGEKYVVVRLDKIEISSPSRTLSAEEKNSIRKMLIEEKKEKIMDDWVNDLRKKASIKVLLNGKN